MRTWNSVLLWVGALALLLAAYFIYTSAQRGTVACTQEAMLCEDGSIVGRSGPSCSFATCPSVAVRGDWLYATSTDGTLAFQYPADVGHAQYVHATDWPPTVSLSHEPFSCEQSTTTGAVAELKTLDHPYCIVTLDDAAAGSRYSTYTYSYAKDQGVVSISFVIRRVQCLNYDAERQSACAIAESNFSVDTLALSIAKTVRFLAPRP